MLTLELLQLQSVLLAELRLWPSMVVATLHQQFHVYLFFVFFLDLLNLAQPHLDTMLLLMQPPQLCSFNFQLLLLHQIGLLRIMSSVLEWH